MAKRKISLRYTFEKAKRRLAQFHIGKGGKILCAATVLTAPFVFAPAPIDKPKQPEYKFSDQSTPAGDAAYADLSAKLAELRNERAAIFDVINQKSEALHRGEDPRDLRKQISAMDAAYDARLLEYYGQLLTNEDISEAQFAQLQQELVDYKMHLFKPPTVKQSGYYFDLKGMNPATFKECQADENQNKALEILTRAQNVDHCMDKLAPKPEAKQPMTVKSYVVNTTLWGLALAGLYLLSLPAVRPAAQKPAPKRQNHNKKRQNKR